MHRSQEATCVHATCIGYMCYHTNLTQPDTIPWQARPRVLHRYHQYYTCIIYVQQICRQHTDIILHTYISPTCIRASFIHNHSCILLQLFKLYPPTPSFTSTPQHITVAVCWECVHSSGTVSPTQHNITEWSTGAVSPFLCVPLAA